MKNFILTLTILLLFISAEAQTRLKIEDRRFWNEFIDSCNVTPANVQSKFEAFCNKKGCHYEFKDFIIAVQAGIVDYRNKALDEIHTGKTVYDGSDNQFMATISKIDGIAGPKTLAWKFPNEQEKIYNKFGTLVRVKDNTLYR